MDMMLSDFIMIFGMVQIVVISDVNSRYLKLLYASEIYNEYVFFCILPDEVRNDLYKLINKVCFYLGIIVDAFYSFEEMCL